MENHTNGELSFGSAKEGAIAEKLYHVGKALYEVGRQLREINLNLSKLISQTEKGVEELPKIAM